MNAKILIEVTEREDIGKYQFKVEMEGSNKLLIEGLAEALAQVESCGNKLETALLRDYSDFRLNCVREEHDNAN